MCVLKSESFLFKSFRVLLLYPAQNTPRLFVESLLVPSRCDILSHDCSTGHWHRNRCVSTNLQNLAVVPILKCYWCGCFSCLGELLFATMVAGTSALGGASLPNTTWSTISLPHYYQGRNNTGRNRAVPHQPWWPFTRRMAPIKSGIKESGTETLKATYEIGFSTILTVWTTRSLILLAL